MSYRLPVLILTLAALVAACTTTTSNPSATCTPGATLPCACAGGGSGVQTCKDDHTLDACACSDANANAPADSPSVHSTSKVLHIVDFSTSAQRITTDVVLGPSGPMPGDAQGSVSFSVIVSPPDAVSGGKLVDETGADYGAFTASAEKSTFTLSTTWSKIQAARAIDFTGASTTRGFIARFFDSDGGFVEAATKLELYCKSDAVAPGACGGKCIDLTSNDFCGSCTKRCSGTQGCADGACKSGTMSPCFANGGTTCRAHCKSIGKSCVVACTDQPNIYLPSGIAIFSGNACEPGYMKLDSCEEPLWDGYSGRCCCA